MPPAIVFPALYVGTRELLASLRTMPGSVLPVVEARFLSRTGYDGPCLVDDFTDTPRLLAKLDDWCRSTGRTVTGVLGIDDEDQFALSRAVARHFGVGFPADETLSIASNKYLQKCRFVRSGVPTGNFALLRDGDVTAGEHVGFPNVLKTLTGSGSEYVVLNRDPGELAGNARDLRAALGAVGDDPRYGLIPSHVPGRRGSFDTRREFLLEEYLEGQEFSCDVLIRHGQARPLRVVKKLRGGSLGNFAGFFLMNEDTAAAEGVGPEVSRALGRRVARALGVSEGVLMVDFVVGTDGLARVLETSIRPGLSIFVPLMERLYGYTSLGLAARLLAGEDRAPALPGVEGLAVYLVADRPGTVVTLDVSRLEAAREALGVIEVVLYVRPGEAVYDSRHDHFDLILGYVLLHGPGREQVEMRAREVQALCQIEVTPPGA